MEILECWEPAALAFVCRTLAEDYANRTAGLPDLFLWKKESATCKFVEVKGPGDNLQENQKVCDSMFIHARHFIYILYLQLWVAILLQANVDIEVCRVASSGPESKSISKPKSIPIPKPAVKLKAGIQTKLSPIKMRKHEDEAIIIDSGSDNPTQEVDYSQLDREPVDSEPETPRREEVKEEPTPRRSARQRAETKYRFDVPEEVREYLDAQVKVEVGGSGSSPKKRKRSDVSS